MLDPEFAPMLEGVSLDALEADPATIVGTWADGRIGYLNPAYQAFADAAGAKELCVHWGLGSSVHAAVPEPLRSFYVGLFDRALATLEPITHEYECPSPTLARTYALRLHPLAGGRGILMSQRLVVARPHAETSPAEPDNYRGANGIVVQCMHCRRVRRALDHARWDLVPEYVARAPEGTSHGVCSLCLEYHYGAVARV